MMNFTGMPFMPLYLQDITKHPDYNFSQYEVIDDNLLNLVFIFGVLASCTILTCCKKTKEKTKIIYVKTEDFKEDYDCEANFVKAEIVETLVHK